MKKTFLSLASLIFVFFAITLNPHVNAAIGPIGIDELSSYPNMSQRKVESDELEMKFKLISNSPIEKSLTILNINNSQPKIEWEENYLKYRFPKFFEGDVKYVLSVFNENGDHVTFEGSFEVISPSKRTESENEQKLAESFAVGAFFIANIGKIILISLVIIIPLLTLYSIDKKRRASRA